MGSRLVIALSVLLLVATANATAILGNNDATALSNFGTGLNVGTAISAGNPYFPDSTTYAATNEDAAWSYIYYTSSPNYQNPALITTTSLVPTSFVDYNSDDWVGFCDCTSTSVSDTEEVAFETNFYISNSGNLTGAYLDMSFAGDTTVSGSYLEVVINGNVVYGINGNSAVDTVGGAIGYDQLNTLDITNGATGCNGCIVGMDPFNNPSGKNVLQVIIVMPDSNGPATSDPNGILVQFGASDDGTGGGPTPPPPSGTPEPGSAILVVTGIAALVAGVRRSKRS
jgi:hypothetical protein